MEWMLLPYRRYADFSGRSRRKEYWLFALFQFIVSIAIFGIMVAGRLPVDQATGQTDFGPTFSAGIVLFAIFSLGSFMPALAVAVRRFHDQDKSGWMLLLYLIPYVGPVIVLVLLCIDGTSGPNRFGPDPKDLLGANVFA
jgi:uncharacterized membrane protein YhaH (DUF805 family)